MRVGIRSSVIAALMIVLVTMSAFAVIGAQGHPVSPNKPITGIENPVVVAKAQGGGSDVSRTWVSPVNGYFHQWLENDGLKGIAIYTYDITSGRAIKCSTSQITFSAAGAYPTGTVQIGYFEVVKDHVYKWTFSPSGRVGTSAQYFWMLENKLTPPVASFTLYYTGTILNADASSSYDPDGTITAYIWEWGDGMVGNGVTASHQYATYGGHQVSLMVVDNDDLKSTLTKSIPPPLPCAIYGYAMNTVGVGVSGSVVTAADIRTGASVSAVSDGIGAYQLDLNTIGGGWKVGDVLEVVATWGTMSGQVRITLTDPNPSFIRIDVTMSADGMIPPIVSFTLTYSGTLLVADASASFDPDGWIVYYQWDWMDGTTSPGVVASHQYAVAEGHQVKLTLTDNDGQQSSMTQSIYPPLPFTVYGSTLDSNGAPLPGCAITLTVLRTGAGMSTTSDASAIYWFDVNTIYGGWQVGDTIEVQATLGTMGGSVQKVLTVPNAAFLQVDVTLLELGIAPPVALFTLSYSGTVLFANASEAYDPDGTIAQYVWVWGDGSLGSGVKASHRYEANAGHSVKLIVTDNDGLTGSRTGSIPPGSPFIVYGFTSGLGGSPLSGCSIELTNFATGAKMTTVSDSGSAYSADLSAMHWGYTLGDTIVVTATKGTVSGSSQFLLTTYSPPYVQVSITLS